MHPSSSLYLIGPKYPSGQSEPRSAVFGSGGEIGHQLYKEFGAGKLDCVDFQSVPTDEAQGAGYNFWRLDAARAAQEQTQASGQNADAKKEDLEMNLGNENSLCSCQM
jgi:hypothetical protein